MLFQTPPLDDYDFQKIVDEAKKLIPRFCPEWTDHNVSDPGVALIELFAWMTDLLLFRVNQVPDRMYLKFLELIGRRLEPARASKVPVTLYLTSPPKEQVPIQIKSGVRVSTERTELQEAILFTTIEPATVSAPRFHSLYFLPEKGTWRFRTAEDLQDNKQPLLRLVPDLRSRKPDSSGQDSVEGAVYMALEEDCSSFVLDLSVTNTNAVGIGIDPNDPPIQWEALIPSTRSDHQSRWVPCEVERDETAGFTRGRVDASITSPDTTPNVPGDERLIRLRLPAHLEKSADLTPWDGPATGRGSDAGRPYYWLRCRIIRRDGKPNFSGSPEISTLRVASMGVTVLAENSIAVEGERLGFSDGTAGQIFALRHSPVLPLIQGEQSEEHRPGEDLERRTPARELDERIRVIAPRVPDSLSRMGSNGADAVRSTTPDKQESEPWTCVRDFTSSKEDDPHFMLDNIYGRVIFGPTLLQPDGKVYCFGKIPPKGSEIVFERYRHGGGVRGNVAAETISVLREQVPFVRTVRNWKHGIGGLDAETLEYARFRVPEFLRKPTQAVTPANYEAIARLDPGIGRAKCIAPGEAGSEIPVLLGDGKVDLLKPGQIMVYLVQKELDRTKRIDRVDVAADTQERVRHSLAERSLVGVTVRVRAAESLVVHVQAEAVSHRPNHREIEVRAREALESYLNPCFGGPDGHGWPFGKALYESEIMAVLSRLPEIDYVKRVEIRVDNPNRAAPGEALPGAALTLHPYEVLCSGNHVVRIDDH